MIPSESQAPRLEKSPLLISIGVSILFLSVAVFCLGAPKAAAKETLSSRVTDFLEGGETGEGEEGWFGFGPDKLWRVRSGVEVRTRYDSNVNREPSGKTDSDFIFGFRPSIEVSRIGTLFGLQSDYALIYEQYLKDHRQSGFSHQWGIQSWYAGENLSVKFGNSFKFAKAYATSEQNERRTVLVNEVYPEIAYRLGQKFSLSAIYNNSIFHYAESILTDNSYTSSEYGGRLYYHTTPKLDIYVQGSATTVDYYHSGLFDSRGYGVYIGTYGKLTERIRLNLETGFLSRDYEDGRINAYRNWVWEGIVNYRLTSKMDLSLQLKRNVQESVYQRTGWYEPHRLGLNLAYHATRHVTLEGGGNFQGNRYSRETPEGDLLKKRKDYLMQTFASVQWTPFRHFALSVRYGFDFRESNFNVFDYTEQSVECTAGYHF